MRVVIDVDPQAEPIGGRVSSAEGPDVAFAGWLDLFQAVEAALSGDGSRK